MELKDALVAADPKRVQTTSETVLELLNKLPSTGLGSATKNQLETIRVNLNAMINKNSLEIQRASFVQLSAHMIRIAVKLKNPSRPIYVQHCPMANSNQGADWLSWEKEIKNPYYGEAMLTCGEVLKTL
jgi:Cu(I)/Ag(I) efflux system membrane fusion protein